MNEDPIIKLLLLHYLIHRFYIVLMKLEKTIFHTSKIELYRLWKNTSYSKWSTQQRRRDSDRRHYLLHDLLEYYRQVDAETKRIETVELGPSRNRVN